VAAAVATLGAAVLLPGTAWAHDAHVVDGHKQAEAVGRLQAALPGALIGRAHMAAATPGHPQVVPFSGELTNLPDDPNVSYPSPSSCQAPMRKELQVDVPAGTKTLYGGI